jgi:hypothetical protein
MNSVVRISWIVASAILFISGVMHVQGIFFTNDLDPDNAALIELMKSTSIQMDKTGTMWNLWIGFHAMFGVCLIFIGSTVAYLSAKHFSTLCKQHFLLLLTIFTVGFFVWVGYAYLIMAFVVSMAVPLVLYIIGYALTLLRRDSS